MRRITRWILISLALLVLLFAVAVVAALALPAAPAAAPDLSWQVIAGGGATMSSGTYTLLSTAGQPVVGTSAGGSYSLLSGYWQSFQAIVREFFLYFPSVRG